MEERSDDMDGLRKETEEVMIEIGGGTNGVVKMLEEDEDARGESPFRAGMFGEAGLSRCQVVSFSGCIPPDPLSLAEGSLCFTRLSESYTTPRRGLSRRIRWKRTNAQPAQLPQMAERG